MSEPRGWLHAWRQRREQKRIRAILDSPPPGPTSAEALVEHEAPFARYYSERWVTYGKALEGLHGLAEQAMKSEDPEYATGGLIPGPGLGDPPLLADFDRCTLGRDVAPYAMGGDSVVIKVSEGVAYIPSDVEVSAAAVEAIREMGYPIIERTESSK